MEYEDAYSKLGFLESKLERILRDVTGAPLYMCLIGKVADDPLKLIVSVEHQLKQLMPTVTKYDRLFTDLVNRGMVKMSRDEKGEPQYEIVKPAGPDALPAPPRGNWVLYSVEYRNRDLHPDEQRSPFPDYE